MVKKKAIFLDRDGTLTKDQGYVHNIEDFELLPGVIEGLKLLKKDYIFLIITNQPGIGMGVYTWADFAMFQGRVLTELSENDITIEKTYVCGHAPDAGCECRKPSTVNLDKAVKVYKIDVAKSWVIGDHPSDVQLGINAGCRTVYLCTGHGESHYPDLRKKSITPTFICRDFYSAAEKIVQSLQKE